MWWWTPDFGKEVEYGIEETRVSFVCNIVTEQTEILFLCVFVSQLLCLRTMQRCTRWRMWLRHYATSRKIAGSILVGIIGIFHWHNPSGNTMALVSTQPLPEMSTTCISLGVKAACAKGWQPYYVHCWLDVLEPQLPGTLRVFPGIAFALM
jgi:hypothetical protein